MFASRLLAGWVWDALSWCRTQYDVSLPGYGWSDWLKQFSAVAPIKECYCVRRRRTQSIPQGAVTNVVARLPSMLRRFLPDSSDSFGWSHICAVFVAILSFTLWGNTHARFIFTWSIASPKQSVTRIKPAPEVIRGCWKLVRYQKKI